MKPDYLTLTNTESGDHAKALLGIRRALGSQGAKLLFSTPKLREAKSQDLSISFPHRVAMLSLRDIRAGRELRKSAQLDEIWRVLILEKRKPTDVGSGDGPAAEAHAAVAAVTTKPESYDPSEINEGPFAEGTEKAIRIAESLGELRGHSFEAILVMAPALYVGALWLKSMDEKGENDLVLPIAPSPALLEAYKPITTADFMRGLRQLAKPNG